MLEKALQGGWRYGSWILFLLGVLAVGFLAYLYQLTQGLAVTGMSRDVTWGLYIGQLTFMVGIAASAVVLVLPYYLHNYKAFGRITILGEFLAVSAVTICPLFVLVDLGQPARFLNLFLHPTPSSVMFWDALVILGYLILNLIIGFTALETERRETPPPRWLKPLIYLSIPWAVSIHTVTAFLYAGLPGRHFWMTAVMAPRFLSSAFAAGPSLLILLIYVLKKTTGFEAGREAVQKLAQVIAYALIINVFLLLMEIFTAFYSGIPDHGHTFLYLFAGVHGKGTWAPWMWLSVAMALTSIVLLLIPRVRENEKALLGIAVMILASLWIDKGLGLVIGGFVPSPLGHVTEYIPTLPELLVTLGVYAIGALILTVLYKIVVEVKQQESPLAA